MPLYEYRCKDCRLIFTVRMSMADHEQKTIACPACQGEKVAPHYSTFYVKTSKKS